MNILEYLEKFTETFGKNEGQEKVPHKKPEKLRDEIAASGMGGGLGPEAVQVPAEQSEKISPENFAGLGGNSPTFLGGE